MNITATHINYYQFCKRQLWLSLKHINMEEFNSDVKIGKIIEKNSYKRRSKKNKNVLFDNIKVDYIDRKNKILFETKKSSKNINSAIWQMKYYLYSLKSEYKGIIEIPTEKQKINVFLEKEDFKEIENIKKNIVEIYKKEIPKVLNGKKCLKCAFHEFCYS